jgi:hypothetical protein
MIQAVINNYNLFINNCLTKQRSKRPSLKLVDPSVFANKLFYDKMHI